MRFTSRDGGFISISQVATLIISHPQTLLAHVMCGACCVAGVITSTPVVAVVLLSRETHPPASLPEWLAEQGGGAASAKLLL